jgi:hypothetical protein
VPVGVQGDLDPSVAHEHRHGLDVDPCGDRRWCRPAPDRRCALTERPRASPSHPPDQAPGGVGCNHCNDHEHERPDARLRVRPFPATTTIPAGTTASADFSIASAGLPASTVPFASSPTVRTRHGRHPR